ncbi:unnamed protein product [Cochlearia groenlandica]
MSSTTLSGNYGFPLCISGISQHLSLSKEMADHDKRRKDLKKLRRSESNVERFNETWLQENEDDRDLFQDLGLCCISYYTAKAA